MDKLSELFNSVPQSFQWVLAGVGALYLSSKVLVYFQFVLDAFVLSGTDVSAA